MNCAGGDTVSLTEGDSLRKVPKSHRELVTPTVRAAFADPRKHFRGVARRCRFRGLKSLLKGFVESDRWELRLHTNAWSPPGIASFAFLWQRSRIVEFSPAEKTQLNQELPTGIVEFYDLVNWIHWSEYGAAGGLERAANWPPVTAFGVKLKGRKVNPRETWILGSTECGDMFLFTKNGAGGMLCHENGYVHLIGSIEETIDWIFDELATGRTPQFDYNAWLPKRH